ncbi:RNA ligase family protein [Paenibacillus sp. sgz500958]|uniref:ATP-dependent DNA ligase n=1 Tax=Paenibacillus sp. sgz500958 TaxID=3242475 RepID=UPI0036D34D3F
MKFSPVVPFEPVISQDLPDGDAWIAQIKWDGVRMLAYYDGTSTELINRRGNRRTLQYPELNDVTAYCKADSVILDGEIIALKQGKPSFHEIMQRDSLRKEQAIQAALSRIPVIYMVFDILYCNGHWTVDQPLSQRQLLLSEMVIPHPHVQVVPSYNHPAELLNAARTNGLEGIICKNPNSMYAPGGKDKRWLKYKIISDLNAVAGGFTIRDGRINAVVLGLYDDDNKLQYIGHAGPGRLNSADWRKVIERGAALSTKICPFATAPARGSGVIWIEPMLVFKVNYLEWNASGTLRHPVIQAEVQIPPGECRLERHSF